MPSQKTLHTAEGRIFLEPVIEQLINVRHQRGIPQDAIDSTIGWADRLCSKYEARVRTPSLYMLLLWLEVLQVRLEVVRNDIPGAGNEVLRGRQVAPKRLPRHL
jgi:hypothetical protein